MRAHAADRRASYKTPNKKYYKDRFLVFVITPPANRRASPTQNLECRRGIPRTPFPKAACIKVV